MELNITSGIVCAKLMFLCAASEISYCYYDFRRHLMMSASHLIAKDETCYLLKIQGI